MRAYAVLLGVLSLAFAARVAGQLLVALFGVGWLPPMDAWYSGLIPYPALFPIQLIILAVQLALVRQLWIGAGPITIRRPGLGRLLAAVSLVYFLVMVARFVATQVIASDPGRFGGTIPIVFHWVLAAYLWVLSRHLRDLAFFGRSDGSDPSPTR